RQHLSICLDCESDRRSGAVFCEEVLQGCRYFATVATAPAKFAGYIVGDIARPASRGVERHYPHRIFILTVEQVFNQRLAVSIRFVGLAPDPAENAEMVQYEIDVAVGILGHDRRRRGHHATPTKTIFLPALPNTLQAATIKLPIAHRCNDLPIPVEIRSHVGT